jgi:hypothetical protein
MKPILTITLVFLLLAGTRCKTITPLSENPHEEPTIIRVECTNDKVIHNTVVQLLRQKRVADWILRDLGATEEIEAKYASIHPGEAERIKELLTQIGGVITVEIKKDGMPVRNVR